MKKEDLIKYAMKGLSADIDELEKSINQGKRFLLQYERGEQPKTPKTPQEIKAIIQDKKAEIERLARLKSDLQWELVENEQ